MLLGCVLVCFLCYLIFITSLCGCLLFVLLIDVGVVVID